MSYSSAHVSNSILALSFSDGQHITPDRLQSLLLLLEAEYWRKSGKRLTEEPFLAVTGNGLAFYSSSWKFDCYCGGTIARYARDPLGRAYHIPSGGDSVFDSSLALVWSGTRRYNDEELAQETTRCALWRKCLDKEGESSIEATDVLGSLRYREAFPEFS